MPKSKQNPKQHDMTLREFLDWMRQRRQRRRLYTKDSSDIAAGKQRFGALLFFVLMTVVMTVCMSQTMLHYSPNAAVTPYTEAEKPLTPTGNPALSIDEVRCSVSVQIGTGRAISWNTTAMTVAEVLNDIGYAYSPDDIITPALDTVVDENTQISVTVVTYEESEEIVSVPYGTVYEDVRTIPRGTTARVSYGKNGIAKQLQRRRYENGELVMTDVLDSETVEEPIDEVLRRGVGGVVSGKSGTFEYSYYIDVTATAYGGYDEPRYTYTGTLAKEGVIAVDPTVIPLGTKVYVKGDYGDYGYCSADDIGGGIKGYHIDIFMECSIAEMMQFGIRNMRVYIID
ncbi:MAG: G5 domain-containing protein [Clostridia bacterium]|nr:G5 domain-containing protein [Clostridia bacterium]